MSDPTPHSLWFLFIDESSDTLLVYAIINNHDVEIVDTTLFHNAIPRRLIILIDGVEDANNPHASITSVEDALIQRFSSYHRDACIWQRGTGDGRHDDDNTLYNQEIERDLQGC